MRARAAFLLFVFCLLSSAAASGAGGVGFSSSTLYTMHMYHHHTSGSRSCPQESPRHRRGKFPALSRHAPATSPTRGSPSPPGCVSQLRLPGPGRPGGLQFPSRSVLPAGPTPGAPTPPPKPLLPSRTKAPRAWLLCAMPQLLQPGAANAAGLPLSLAPLSSVGQSTHERYRAKRPHTPHKPCPQARAF
jgi:hypothetical protein